MTELHNLIPYNGVSLVKYSGNKLIDKLGKEIILNVVMSLLCGDNIRNLTEGLTQRRIMLMNASLFITYIRALSSFDNFTERLSSIVESELKGKLASAEKTYLKWFIGLTGKSVQNVLRDSEYLNSYLSSLDKNVSEISDEVKGLYGELSISVNNEGEKCLLKWPDLLRCMYALGAQTLSVRGSEKSIYGKLFEKFTLGSVLTILGFQYVNRKDRRNNMVFWLSEREENNRESDATVLLRPGSGIRFDIGFIGVGNTEVSLDKVSRYEKEMERNGKKSAVHTIVLVDRIGEGSRIFDKAEAIGGHIIQMSGTYWVYSLAKIIKRIYNFYDNPILHISKEQSLDYIKDKMPEVNLTRFLSSPAI